VRDRAQKETTATVEDRTGFPTRQGAWADQPGEAVPAEFGLHVEELTPDRGVASEWMAEGVMVTEIDPATFADDLGFGRGDVIAEINREAISSVSDYRKAVSKLKPGEDVVFKILPRQDSDRIFDPVPVRQSACGPSTIAN